MKEKFVKFTVHFGLFLIAFLFLSAIAISLYASADTIESKVAIKDYEEYEFPSTRSMTKAVVNVADEYAGDHYYSYNNDSYVWAVFDDDDPDYTLLDAFNDSFDSSYDSIISFSSFYGACRDFEFLIGDGYYSITTVASFFINTNYFGKQFLTYLYFSPDLSRCAFLYPSDLVFRHTYVSTGLFSSGRDYFLYAGALFTTFHNTDLCFRFVVDNATYTFGEYISYDTVLTNQTFTIYNTFAFQEAYDRYLEDNLPSGLFPWIEAKFLPLFGEVPTEVIDMGIFGSWSALQFIRVVMWVTLGLVCCSAFVVLPYCIIRRLLGIKKRGVKK